MLVQMRAGKGLFLYQFLSFNLDLKFCTSLAFVKDYRVKTCLNFNQCLKESVVCDIHFQKYLLIPALYLEIVLLIRRLVYLINPSNRLTSICM